ncbi:MAG: 50S ribosomal protein L25 [Candidatus Woesebacteria bacterium GW2011_GWA1_33_30]|uniref:Large ribosomal subunit protein bL25 n=1 Tax=Candidatus Woesebacteria bacterium GW2011_GWA2_33_28 TaxID=1618561 RepID=A0A0F9ZQS4_9BACT|nr:MAG: 50S ribosomal protein L25 [Candidatus Woesebacteria bacterium GW2011_GWA2_33_28]KKP47294.1 MAG: 50S ribosomal protein L25 [Candidatus Woesebacteria bacterium GW2011_GWA1_33_30]KKP48939.1 MAG: 50S ribosomal protein L25 [Microgenomates group bacterium GW2011_GWC1_33_32]KKP51477.1 MAG: 50S ribosomal protein L25 [Candidatus Woesebacteria bacterium GW2011_GWB1_33_38]KKP57480.1 MAG: 50S ribosomal protein L25 [Microgenomates group bacterium GW2011_GWD1_33_9]
MTSTKFSLKATKREVFGRKVKRFRKEGLAPANIFGKKIKSEAIFVNKKEFTDVFAKAGETQIIHLNDKPVLVSGLQIDPVTSDYLHVDFRRVDLTEKITAKVPVEIVGESPAEKQKMGTVVQQLSEIEVEALPADLPEKIEIDATTLIEVDQTIYVKDLKIDKKVTIKTDLESIVAKVEPPTKEEVVEVVAPVEDEVPVEGEQPKEGETKPAEETKTT